MQLAQGYITNDTFDGEHIMFEAVQDTKVTFIQMNNVSGVNDIGDAVDVDVKIKIRYENDFVYITPGGTATIGGTDAPFITYENLNYDLVAGNQIIAVVSHDKKLSFILQGE